MVSISEIFTAKFFGTVYHCSYSATGKRTFTMIVGTTLHLFSIPDHIVRNE